MDDKENRVTPENQDPQAAPETPEFSLEDIMKEFGDESQPVAEKTPEQILSEVEKQLQREQQPEQPAKPPETPAEPAQPVSGETVRIEKISQVHGQVHNAQPVDDEADAQPVQELPEKKTEPYSEEWEPEYEQPIGDYVPQKVISFQPRSRLRELKKKLVEGPERLYYTLSEKGLGKLQLAIFFSVLLVLICAVATAMYALGAVPENRLRLMVFWQFFAMLVAALLGSFQLLEGIMDLASKKFTLNTMLVFTFLICCVDGVMCLGQVRVPCCAAFALQVTMSLWSTYHKRNTKLGKLDTMRKASRLYSVTAVEDYYEGTKGLVRDDGRVEDFMQTLDQPCGMEKILQVYALVAACISVAAGVMAGVLHGLGAGIQVAAVTSLAAVPATMFVTLSRPMAVLERRHHALGTVLCGWQGVEGLSGKAVFPLDHDDLFPGGTIKMNGVKFFGDRSPDQIVAYATALIEADGGSLSSLFIQLLESRNGRHYTAQNFNSYGGGGIGAQVNGEAVLAGTLQFLESMGVETPQGIRVDQAVCVAVDGELCGLFAIAYELDNASVGGLATLCSYRKLNTLVTTGDFVITPEFIQKQFGVKTKRMIFPEYSQRAQLRERKPEPEALAQALTTTEGVAPFAYAVTGARALKKASTAGVVVHMIGGIVGIAMMLVLGFLGATYLLTPASMFLYELLWMIPGLLITEWTRSI